MKSKLITFLIISFISISLSAFADGWDGYTHTNTSAKEEKDKTMSIEILINGTSKIEMHEVPLSGYLEIYSIMGLKVKNINLKQCVSGCSVDLPKGYYIFRAGRVALKVVAR